MTCADDGTMRLWLMENQGKKSKSVIKTKNRKSGLKCHPTSCTYSRWLRFSLMYISTYHQQGRFIMLWCLQ